jgi:SRSO17 transposase
MDEPVPESKSRNLQQFLTHSKWDHRGVMDHVAQDVDKHLDNERNACPLRDESGFDKQGQRSIGVLRQWLGELGKLDNVQEAVFGAFTKGQYVALLMSDIT